MQGHLNEIDIRSILQLIELGQRTGELYVEAYVEVEADRLGDSNTSDVNRVQRSWLVFFLNGQIVYAGTTDGQLERLRDYLHRYGLDCKLDSTVVFKNCTVEFARIRLSVDLARTTCCFS